MAVLNPTHLTPDAVHKLGQACPVCYSLPNSAIRHDRGVVVIELLCPSGHIWRVTYLSGGMVSA